MKSTTANLANTATSTSTVISHLDEMDKYYAKSREADPTMPGTEDRTFEFRVEFAHDIAPLAALVGWAVETWWQSPVCPWGDADVKMTLRPNTLTTEELRWLFGQVVDCHVAMETLEPSVNYTGDRRYQDEYELAAVVPTPENLSRAIAGLREYMDCLDNSRERADEALDALEGGADAWSKKVHLQHFSSPDEQAIAFMNGLQKAGKLESFMAELASVDGWPSDSVLPVVARGG